MRIYRINWMTGDRPPVYKTSKAEVRAWFSRNPGEADSWEAVDVLGELDRLASALADADQKIADLERQIKERE